MSLPQSLKQDGKYSLYQEMIEYMVPRVMEFLFGREASIEEEQRLESLKTVI
jgi:hypothetical protein